MIATDVPFSFDFIISFTHQTEYTHGPGTYYQDSSIFIISVQYIRAQGQVNR